MTTSSDHFSPFLVRDWVNGTLLVLLLLLPLGLESWPLVMETRIFQVKAAGVGHVNFSWLQPWALRPTFLERQDCCYSPIAQMRWCFFSPMVKSFSECQFQCSSLLILLVSPLDINGLWTCLGGWRVIQYESGCEVAVRQSRKIGFKPQDSCCSTNQSFKC